MITFMKLKILIVIFNSYINVEEFFNNFISDIMFINL